VNISDLLREVVRRAYREGSVNAESLGTERDDITGKQFGSLHPLAVDVTAVLGFKIDQNPSAFAEEEFRVAPGDASVREQKIAARAAAEQEVR
jgi:hypothetical protein